MKNDKSVNICIARTVGAQVVGLPDEWASDNGWAYLEKSTLYSFGIKSVEMAEYWTKNSHWYNTGT